MKHQHIQGNFSAFFAASLFGAAVVATRVAVQDIPPLSLAVLRFAQGGSILFLCLLLFARNLLKVDRKDVPYLVLLGAVFFAVFPFTFHMGMRFTEASRGALMVATMPVWSAFLARAAKKEQLNIRQISGILITVLGVGIVIAERGLHWRGEASALIGDGFMLVTAFLAAVYGVLAQRMFSRYSAVTVTTYAMLFGTLLLLPAALIEGLPRVFAIMDGKLIALVLFLGIIGGGFAFFLWTFALTRLSPTQVAVYANLNPVAATILGVVLLSERLTGIFLAGFVLIVGGVLLVNWPKKAGSK